MEESNEDNKVIPELYFLIAKFLSGGPLKETAKTLLKELENVEVLPRRLDWEGNEHTQTYDELASLFRDLSDERLVEVCRGALAGARGAGLGVRHSLLGGALGARPPPSATVHALPHRVLQRELGLGPRAPLTPRALAGLRLQRRTLGHLSAVYCLAFDRTGRYVMTGADDLLVKVWSAVDGRLVGTLRGCGAEVTDVCVSHDGALLAVGSVERLVRVWELAGGSPRAVLAAHAGTITSVHWAPPARRDLRWLASTSTDGSVAFWTCSPDGQFLSQPVQYVERMRPGACHMICAAWSPGGAFLAAGSADHHVRVYAVQTEPPGPRRVLETPAHHDAVDSIAWAHRQLRFVSGSKDGSAALWGLHATQWRHTLLVPRAEEGRRLKVTMVCWECSDALVATAVSDCSVRVWCARTGTEVRVLRAHADEAYVLEPHPHLRGVLLSAGHDGLLCVWDAARGERIATFRNTIEGQGEGALFDAKWAPDGASVAATDSHGHLALLGLGAGHPLLRDLPTELFFHTDYRPLVRDALGGALDEQTMLPPHALPPPFLVDVEGAPHPPYLQRLVPGRERADPAQLQPVEPPPPPGAPPPPSPPPPPLGGGGVWRGGGVRHAGGGWQQPDPLLLPPSTAPMVPPLPLAEREHIESLYAEMNAMEIAWWRREMRRRPVMISTAGEGGGGRKRAPRPRPARPSPRVARPPPEEAVESSSSHSDTLSSSVQLSERSSESESGGSAWERGPRTRRRARPASPHSPPSPPSPPAARSSRPPRRRRAARRLSSPEPSPPPSPVAGPSVSPPPSPPPATSPAPTPPPVPLAPCAEDEWLLAVTPRRTPYTPQLGDEVVYFRIGHQRYLEAVAEKDIYKITTRDKPWDRMHIYEAEPVKVTDIKYMVRNGVRVASLRLASSLGERRAFTVRYHDMPDVIDFLVLRAQYEAGVRRPWAAGDRFQCCIDDRWWRGAVLERLPPASPPHAPTPAPASAWSARAHTHFLSVRVRWDNGEVERLSPWDLEPLDAESAPPPAEPAEWGGAQAVAAERLRTVMTLACAEQFLAPPATPVAYPVDLRTVLARLERRYYRRAAAAAHDARQLAHNARRSGDERVARNGRIVAALVCACVERGATLDVVAEYRALGASTGGEAGGTRAWQAAAQGVVAALLASPDAGPFARPVSPRLAPDYRAVVARPMDLGTVSARLAAGRYATAERCCADLRRIFANSRLYNTNKRSQIYSMTVRLSSLFEALWARSVPAPCSSDSESSEPLAAASRRRRARADSSDSDRPLANRTSRRKGKGVGKKSKSSTGSTEPSTSGAALRHHSPAHDDEEYVPLEGSEEEEYSQIEVLEEELPDEDVDLTYTDNTDAESLRSRSRKRAMDSDASYGRRKKRTRRKHYRRVDRTGSSSSSAASSERAESDGSYRPRAESAEDGPRAESDNGPRADSDRSYRDDSDDDTPLHLYRRGQGGVAEPQAGPSTAPATHNGTTRRGRVSLRARRSPRRYNEDSEEDSPAAISKRSHAHNNAQAMNGRAAGGDHTYYNHSHNHNHSHGSQSETHPLSVSSRGRVRKLTAKARGLLRD